MSLVAYASSDDSDEEPYSNKNIVDVFVNKVSSTVTKNRETVKIAIPSLKEFEDQDEVITKKAKFQPGSGLFSILPPPKHSSTISAPGFTPYVLSKKKGSKKLSPLKSEHQQVPEKDVLKSDLSLPEKPQSSDSELSTDYFSLVNVNIEGTTTVSDFSTKEPSSSAIPASSYDSPLLSASISKDVVQHEHVPLTTVFACNSVADNQSSSQILNNSCAEIYSNSIVEPKPPLSLLEEGFLKLQGRRREIENVDIIEVNADDQLTNKNEWLMQSLTEEKDHRPSKRKHDMPTHQQKRKHQITYLAFQAKERELDLKNQWALNSRTRRETQAKYGF